MALIGQIRKNGWILIVLMALALGGFILMEIMGNLNRNSQGDVNTLARVNGKDIKYSNFENYQNIIYGNAQQDPYQVRNDVWDYFLENALVKDEADKMGLGIGRDELQDLQFGTNLSPVIVQRFSDPNTRQVQRAALQNVKTMMDEGRFTDERKRVYWKTMVEEVIKDRLQSKVVNVVSKGMYTPTWQAEMVFRENNERVDFRYVRIGYEKVSDEESKVTDEDYTNYLKENPNLFSQTEETRVLDYAALDVVPSSADSAAAREVVAKLVDGFRTAANDSNYVALNSGVYETVYKPKNLLSPVAADTLLRLPVGSVVGPYLDGDVWTVAKILGRKTLPDSVRARHILIQGAENPASERTIDSLMVLLNAKRVPFDTLARRNSQDGGSAVKGGDLGWFANGTMVPEFNDVCFVTGEQGKLYKVRTQFGWHIIDITGKKFVKNEPSVKAAYLRQRVEPSKATQQAVKDRAVALIQKSKTLSDLTKSVGQENLSIQSSFPLKANDYLVGSFAGNDARAMVKWAYEDGTDANDVSGEVFSIRDAGGGFFDTKYVVAGLKTITPAGKSDVAALKANPEADQKVKSRKKGEVIASKIQGQTDLGAIAGQWQTKVDTARNASFMQGGSEPRVVGTVFNTGKDAVSAPIIGSNGVYVVSPLTDKPQIQLPPDLTMFRRQLVSTAVSQVKIGLISSMKKTADVEDFRSKFY